MIIATQSLQGLRLGIYALQFKDSVAIINRKISKDSYMVINTGFPIFIKFYRFLVKVVLQGILPMGRDNNYVIILYCNNEIKCV